MKLMVISPLGNKKDDKQSVAEIRFLLMSSSQVRTVVTVNRCVAAACSEGEALHSDMTNVKIKMFMIPDSISEVAPFFCTTLWHRMSTL